MPDEDQGWYIAPVILPDGASLERTDKMVEEVSAAIRSNPFNEHVMAFTGFDFVGGFVFRNNAATIFVTQKHWDERPMPVGALVGEFFGKTGAHQGRPRDRVPAAGDLRPRHRGRLRVLPPEPRRGRAQAPGRGGAAVHRRGARRAPSSAWCNTFWRANVPQLYVDVDREKAKALGVPLDEIFNTLAATLGSYYVNDFNKYGRTWQVLMSAEPDQRKRPEDVGSVYVRSEKGEMIPLRSLARIEYTSGPDTMTRFNNLPAVQVLGSGKPGVSSGDAIAEIERIAREVLPPDFSLDWSGASYQEKKSGGTSVLALGARRADGVPDPRRAVREVVAAAVGDAGAAVRHLRRARRGVAARADQRRVLPDRPGDAARPRGEERDPDRRVRGAEARGGPVGLRRGGRGGAAALPARS